MKATLPTIKGMKFVAKKDRLNFLPKMFENQPALLMFFENIVFNQARKLCPEYDGAYWEFVELDNGAFFIYPDFGGTKPCSCAENWAKGELDGRTLGIICTMLALNHLTWVLYDDEDNVGASELANKLYFSLQDWVYRDETGEAITAVSDADTASNFTKAVYSFLD